MNSGSAPIDATVSQLAYEAAKAVRAKRRAQAGLGPEPAIRGRFYIDRNDDGWQIVDAAYALTIAADSRSAAERTARFVRDYCATHGDVNFESFPYDLNDSLDLDALAKVLVDSETHDVLLSVDAAIPARATRPASCACCGHWAQTPTRCDGCGRTFCSHHMDALTPAARRYAKIIVLCPTCSHEPDPDAEAPWGRGRLT